MVSISSYGVGNAGLTWDFSSLYTIDSPAAIVTTFYNKGNHKIYLASQTMDLSTYTVYVTLKYTKSE